MGSDQHQNPVENVKTWHAGSDCRQHEKLGIPWPPGLVPTDQLPGERFGLRACRDAGEIRVSDRRREGFDLSRSCRQRASEAVH